MNTIYLDCTETYQSPHMTGIQRVVRNLVNESATLSLPDDIERVAVVRHAGSYRVIERIENPAAGPKPARVCDAAWYRSAVEPLCRATGSKELRRLLLPAHGHGGLYSLPQKVLKRLKRHALRQLPRATPQAGDCLINLELGLKRDWNETAQLRQAGVSVGGVLFDLEPIRHPEFFSDRMAMRFEKWLKEAAHHYDFSLTISETVRQQLIEYLRESHIFTRLNDQRIGSFRLGSNLDGVTPQAACQPTVRAELGRAFESTSAPTFLTVGTIEPRKNLQLLLDAMDRAWAAGADVRCCIVGVIGWKCEQLIERIDSHAELHKRLLVYHDLSDQELAYVYGQSQAFVYPTHAEGFGLPLVEALRMGLPCIASDLPILRETSGGQATFVANDSPAELARLLIGVAKGEAELKVPAASHVPAITWEESTRRFMQQVLALSGMEHPHYQRRLAA